MSKARDGDFRECSGLQNSTHAGACIHSFSSMIHSNAGAVIHAAKAFVSERSAQHGLEQSLDR